jgi:hypothetical protein
MDPRACLDDVDKRKFFTLPGLQIRPLGRRALSAVAIPTAHFFCWEHVHSHDFVWYRKEKQKLSIDASKEVGLEVNTEKTMYTRMLLSRHQNARQYQDIKIAYRCFENVARFRYLGTTVTNQNLIQEKIRRYWIRVMLATIQFPIFCIIVSCLKT